jgi:hypothetical protein
MKVFRKTVAADGPRVEEPGGRDGGGDNAHQATLDMLAQRDAVLGRRPRQGVADTPAAAPTPGASVERAVLWFREAVSLPKELESQRHALVSFEAFWQLQQDHDEIFHEVKGKSLAETANEVAKKLVARLDAENAKLRVEISELKAELAGVTAKLGEVKFICERLSVTRQGKPASEARRAQTAREARRA